jgi:hypothetical protein
LTAIPPTNALVVLSQADPDPQTVIGRGLDLLTTSDINPLGVRSSRRPTDCERRRIVTSQAGTIRSLLRSLQRAAVGHALPTPCQRRSGHMGLNVRKEGQAEAYIPW